MNRRLVLDAIAMADLDDRAQREFSIPGLTLMENAAVAVQDFLRKESLEGPYLILAGSGNNGGDALALGRLLHEQGHIVRIFSCPGAFGRVSQSNTVQQKRLTDQGLKIQQITDDPMIWEGFSSALADSPVVIDGLSGIGQKGALHGLPARVVKLIVRQRNHCMQIVALDVPSGLHDAWQPGQPIIPADHCICFGFAKRCLYTALARVQLGNIHVYDIGFPESLADSETPAISSLQITDLNAVLPRLGPYIHKYDRGTVSIFAGSLDFPGAALLCARAAAAGRAGLVRLSLDAPVFNLLAGQAGSLILTQTYIVNGDAVVIGPGWGRAADRMDQLSRLLTQAAERGVCVVIDADALHWLGHPAFPMGDFSPDLTQSWILTPHAGELGRLLGVDPAEIGEKPWHYAVMAAQRWQATVVLKGGVSWIAQADGRVWLLDAANPVLAEAGTGDVFAGICGALLARLHREGIKNHSACLQSAQAAVLLLQSAGMRMAMELGWVPSEHLADFLPRVFAEFSAPEFRNTIYTSAAGAAVPVSEYPEAFMTQSVAGVWLREGEILLARRKSGGDMGGRWELPGGKCEAGEKPEEALKREFMEELGLPINVGPVCASTMFRHGGKDHQVTAFMISSAVKIAFLAEHDEVRWFSLKDLPPRTETVDSDADLLIQISSYQHRFA